MPLANNKNKHPLKRSGEVPLVKINISKEGFLSEFDQVHNYLNFQYSE